MNIQTIFLFESPFVSSLYPFSILHCGWELRTGAFRNFEKLRRLFPDADIVFSGREKHLNSFLARFNPANQNLKKANTLVLNSAVLPTRKFFDELEKSYNEQLDPSKPTKAALFVHNNVPLAAYLPAEEMINPGEFDKIFLPKLLSEFNRLMPNIEISKPHIINFLWDTFDLIEEIINEDFDYFDNHCNLDDATLHSFQYMNPEKIKIGKDVVISAGVVLDASEGPIIIDDNAKIMANAVICGPCCIGKNSVIKIGAKIYGKTSIGPYCKVGGEVENSIIHGYANKQHDGFLGHSYISEWVNLGADTNTSDLKNTYSEIDVTFYKQKIKTGRMFLGLLCGDHSKSAINTSFTTGTVAGICGIIVADGFLPNYIPSFAWRGVKGCTYYKIDKAIETAKIVMQRRNKLLLPEEEELIRLDFGEAKKNFFDIIPVNIPNIP